MGVKKKIGFPTLASDNYLVDNHSCVIVGAQATAARMSQETLMLYWATRGCAVASEWGLLMPDGQP
jgi:hypothetical protein